MFSWSISSLTFSSGAEVQLQPGQILLIIGPNSGGKSTALRDIENYARTGASGRAVVSVHVSAEGDADDLRAWLREKYPLQRRDSSDYFVTMGGTIRVDQLPAQVSDSTRPLAPFLIHRMSTDDRLSATTTVNSFDQMSGQPEKYIHLLQLRDDLASEVSAELHAAFGKALIINNFRGPHVGFHVGEAPAFNPITGEFREALRALPRLEDEGDGIRSFAGTMLAVRCGAHPLLMLDEPEAFLHPPQIRRLMRFVSRSAAESGRQVIVATHSTDAVRGAIDGGANVVLCRLVRDGLVNRPALMRPDTIRELSSRPILRSAAALEGVFHEAVVVCEGDSDARFYEFALRKLNEIDNVQQSDVFFIQGGGKGQIPTIANPYRELSTTTAVIADLDLLRNRTEFNAVARSVGIDTTSILPKVDRVAQLLADLKPEWDPSAVASDLEELAVSLRSSGTVNSTSFRAISESVLSATKWSEAKKYGVHKLRGGSSTEATQLLDELAGQGLFLVPSGGLESWWRGGPADKGAWFAEAIEHVQSSPSDFTALFDFLRRIRAWITLTHPILPTPNSPYT